MPRLRLIRLATHWDRGIRKLNELGRRIGESHHLAKLTDAEVDEIRELHEEKQVGYGTIARKFDVSIRTVRDICAYRIRAQTVMDVREVRRKVPEPVE